jgi:hypothetical protein
MEKKNKHCSLMLSLARHCEIPNGVDFLQNPSKDFCQSIRCTWLALIGLLSVDSIEGHPPKMVKYSKPPLNFSSPNYLWFMQYKDNNCGDVGNA